MDPTYRPYTNATQIFLFQSDWMEYFRGLVTAELEHPPLSPVSQRRYAQSRHACICIVIVAFFYTNVLSRPGHHKRKNSRFLLHQCELISTPSVLAGTVVVRLRFA